MSYEVSKLAHYLAGDPVEIANCPACIKAAKEEGEEGMKYTDAQGNAVLVDEDKAPDWNEIREKMRELASRTVEKYEAERHLGHVKPGVGCRFCPVEYTVTIGQQLPDGGRYTLTVYADTDAVDRLWTPLQLTRDEREAIVKVVKKKITKMRRKAAK